ncbi:helix-turn-helix domain protein [mine drainage metagenome]|uniref:Helix-turn-helix domain protein n=1 Tax=mine drainage metagenome TaxID=410659 RepID=A0A1J5Q832_9ZZZZ
MTCYCQVMDINDFGSRLRQLRIKAGLSQSDLALGIMSPSHVSLMESGRRTPSQELLEQLAERLDVTTEFLLNGPTSNAVESRRKDLLFAEMALKGGDPVFAESSLKSLIGQLESGESSEFEVRVRHLYARVLEQLGRLDEASHQLRQGIELARTSGLPLEAVEMTITLSTVARDAGDFLQALELVNAAQESFPQELRNSATYARLLSSAIAIYWMRGDSLRAEELSDEALAIFDDKTDPAARAAILWNASLAADANQDLPKALMLAQRAAGLYSESDDRRSEGLLRIATSWLFTRQTPPNAAAAREQLDRAASLLADYGTPLDRAALETEFARIEWLVGNFEESLKYAASALTRFSASNDRLQSADAYLLVARSHISMGNEIESSMNLTAARNILAEMEPSRVNAFSWRELGDIYANLGFKTEALNAYREALHDAGVPASSLALSEANKAESGAELPGFR